MSRGSRVLISSSSVVPWSCHWSRLPQFFRVYIPLGSLEAILYDIGWALNNFAGDDVGLSELDIL